jgi:hypothetical protein
MKTTAKRRDDRRPRTSTKVRKDRQPANADTGAKDHEARKKIGETLVRAAFMADFERDTTSAVYWETNA